MLLQIMAIVSAILLVIFGLFPATSCLVAISPLDKIFNIKNKIDDYPDFIACGLFIWLVIAFIVGWIVALLQVFHLI